MDRYTAIRFAARFGVVAKFVSQLFAPLSALTVVPCLFAFYCGSMAAGAAYVLVIALLAGAALLGRRLPEVSRMQRNEAAAVVALAFLIASLLMSLPVMTYGIGFADAWFESVSGITTTGLSTLDLSDKPAAFLFARGWAQWVGGIGVVVLALAVVLPSGHAARNLGFNRLEVDDAVGGTRAHARRVAKVYLALTLIGIAALLAVGATPLDAVVYSMTSVSTGGFANEPNSLADASRAVVTVVSLLCLCGAISFHVYYISILRYVRGKSLDSQFYALMLSVAVTTAIIAALAAFTGYEIGGMDIAAIVISAQTTAGFATFNLSTAPAWLMLLLSISMFVGGGIGSTSGGIKIGRLLFVLSWVRTYFVRTSLPDSAHAEVRVNDRPVESEDLQEIFAVIGAFIAALLVSWLCFLLYDYPALPALFEVTSALATAGLSVGITDSELPGVLKTVLCFDMLFGRVEMVALLVVLMPKTWIGRRRSVAEV